MMELLLSAEKNLYYATSVIRLARQADYDYHAIDIDTALEMATEMIETEREKITNQLIMMYIQKAGE